MLNPITGAFGAEPSQASPILSIEPADAEKIRARKVVTRSRARPTGKYPSWKINRMVQWELPHELNAYRLLDANPAVRSFAEQPCVITYVLDGEKHVHYPNALVTVSQSRELWEIKPRADAAKPDIVARTALLAKELPNLGYQYRLIIAEDLGAQPRLANVLTILKFGRAPISGDVREYLRSVFSRSKSIIWGAVREGALDNDRVRAFMPVCRLLLEGALVLDIGRPLTYESALFWNASARPWGSEL